MSLRTKKWTMLTPATTLSFVIRYVVGLEVFLRKPSSHST